MLGVSVETAHTVEQRGVGVGKLADAVLDVERAGGPALARDDGARGREAVGVCGARERVAVGGHERLDAPEDARRVVAALARRRAQLWWTPLRRGRDAHFVDARQRLGEDERDRRVEDGARDPHGARHVVEDGARPGADVNVVERHEQVAVDAAVGVVAQPLARGVHDRATPEGGVWQVAARMVQGGQRRREGDAAGGGVRVRAARQAVGVVRAHDGRDLAVEAVPPRVGIVYDRGDGWRRCRLVRRLRRLRCPLFLEGFPLFQSPARAASCRRRLRWRTRHGLDEDASKAQWTVLVCKVGTVALGVVRVAVLNYLPAIRVLRAGVAVRVPLAHGMVVVDERSVRGYYVVGCAAFVSHALGLAGEACTVVGVKPMFPIVLWRKHAIGVVDVLCWIVRALQRRRRRRGRCRGRRVAFAVAYKPMSQWISILFGQKRRAARLLEYTHVRKTRNRVGCRCQRRQRRQRRHAERTVGTQDWDWEHRLVVPLRCAPTVRMRTAVAVVVVAFRMLCCDARLHARRHVVDARLARHTRVLDFLMVGVSGRHAGRGNRRLVPVQLLAVEPDVEVLARELTRLKRWRR